MRRIHFWAALAVAVPVLVILISGILLQTKKHWAWVQPHELRGSVTRPAVSLDHILESVKAVSTTKAWDGLIVHSWDDVNRIDLRPARGVAKVWLRNGWEVQVDLGTGNVLAASYRRSDLIESFHDGSYFAGDWTKLGVFLPAGVALAVLWITGMWLGASGLNARKKRKSVLRELRRPASDPVSSGTQG